MCTPVDVNFPNMSSVSYIVAGLFNDNSNSVPYKFEGFAIWKIILKFVPLHLARADFDGECSAPRVDGPYSHRAVSGNRHICLTKNRSGGRILSPTLVGDEVFSFYLHLHLLLLVTMAELMPS